MIFRLFLLIYLPFIKCFYKENKGIDDISLLFLNYYDDFTYFRLFLLIYFTLY
jgi:hypothetical protein